jgi:hypothetical protein
MLCQLLDHPCTNQCLNYLYLRKCWLQKQESKTMNASIQRCFVHGLFLWNAVRAFESQGRSPLTTPRPMAILQRAKCHDEASLLIQIRQSSALFLSGEPGGEAPKKRRKRVKRKEMAEDGGEEEAEEIAEISATTLPLVQELKTRQDGPVNMQVRNLVSGGGPSASGSAQPSVASFSSSTNAASSSGDSLSSDSLRMLLEDAKEMQALEAKGSIGAPAGDNEKGFTVPDSFRNILSTIVTVDFFVVCGFLLWFLAGIFCSYVLKDDTVQIAFNRKWRAWAHLGWSFVLSAHSSVMFLSATYRALSASGAASIRNPHDRSDRRIYW